MNPSSPTYPSDAIFTFTRMYPIFAMPTDSTSTSKFHICMSCMGHARLWIPYILISMLLLYFAIITIMIIVSWKHIQSGFRLVRGRGGLLSRLHSYIVNDSGTAIQGLSQNSTVLAPWGMLILRTVQGFQHNVTSTTLSWLPCIPQSFKCKSYCI